MLIGAFGKRAGIGQHTIRFYIRKGLLSPARGTAEAATGENGHDYNMAHPTNTYYVFEEADLERVQLIRHAQAMGFTLKQIHQQLQAYLSGSLTVVGMIEQMEAQHRLVTQRISELQAMEQYFERKLTVLRQLPDPEAPINSIELHIPMPNGQVC